VQKGGAARQEGEHDEGTQRQALPMVTSLCLHTPAPIIGVVDQRGHPLRLVTSPCYRRVPDVT
jgi:hypothetical protein